MGSPLDSTWHDMSIAGRVPYIVMWAISMLPMVYDALKKQELKTRLRSKYVFLNPDNKPIEITTLRKNACLSPLLYL
jgi:hypothetical protein